MHEAPDTPDVLSYYPYTPPSKLGRTKGEPRVPKLEEDTSMGVVAGSIRQGNEHYERRVFGNGDGLQKHVWHYEQEDVKDVVLSEIREEPKKVALFLPSMLKVDRKGRGGLFSPDAKLMENAVVLLTTLHEVMHESHEKAHKNADKLSLQRLGGTGTWQWKLPWKRMGGGDLSSTLQGYADGCKSSRGSSSTMHNNPCERDETLKREWVCNHFSKFKALHKGNEGWCRFMPHTFGYLQVLLGYAGKQAVYEVAHRILLWTLSGPPPSPGMVTLHACDSPSCLCVAHLTWGSHFGNNHYLKQKAAKG